MQKIKEGHMEKRTLYKEGTYKKAIFTPTLPGRTDYIPHRRQRNTIKAKDMISWH